MSDDALDFADDWRAIRRPGPASSAEPPAVFKALSPLAAEAVARLRDESFPPAYARENRLFSPPHRAGFVNVFDEARKRRVGYELSLVLSGMWPVSCVNPSVLQNTSLRRWQPVSMERGPNS